MVRLFDLWRFQEQGPEIFSTLNVAADGNFDGVKKKHKRENAIFFRHGFHGLTQTGREGSITTMKKQPTKRELTFKQIMKRFNPTLYKLDGKKVVQCKNFADWCHWWILAREKGLRKVGWDKIGPVTISTVFLGIDHGWGRKPVLFETMVFGGKLDQKQWRYFTWEEAEHGHRETVRLVKASLKKRRK